MSREEGCFDNIVSNYTHIPTKERRKVHNKVVPTVVFLNTNLRFTLCDLLGVGGGGGELGSGNLFEAILDTCYSILMPFPQVSLVLQSIS